MDTSVQLFWSGIGKFSYGQGNTVKMCQFTRIVITYFFTVFVRQNFFLQGGENKLPALLTAKTTAIRRIVVRETSVSRHHGGQIEGPP